MGAVPCLPGYCRRSRSGFLLLEALIGFALFSMFLTAIGLSLLASHRGVLAASDRSQGIHLAERMFDVVRSMRDDDFDTLTDGTHGIEVRAGQWALTGSALTSSGFTTSVTVTTETADRKSIAVRTFWDFGLSRSGSVVLRSELADWRGVWSPGNWAGAGLVTGGAVTRPDAVLLRDVLAVQSGATVLVYVTGEDDVAGNGILAVYDATTMPPAELWSETFTGRGIALAVRGDALYVLTDAASSEIRVYDVADGASPAIAYGVNLPGASRGRSLAVRGDVLLVGALADASEAELYSYSIPSVDAFSLSGSLQLDDGGGGAVTVHAIAVRGAFAELATSQDTAEVRVAGVGNPEALTAQTSSGYNLTDRSEDAVTIAVTSTGVLVGTQGGSLFSEAALLSAVGATPTSPPGPWAYEAGSGGTPAATVNKIVVDPTGRYAFLAVEGDRDVQIIDLVRLQNGLSAQIFSDTLTGFGRGLSYLPSADRLYLITDTSLRVYEP